MKRGLGVGGEVGGCPPHDKALSAALISPGCFLAALWLKGNRKKKKKAALQAGSVYYSEM